MLGLLMQRVEKKFSLYHVNTSKAHLCNLSSSATFHQLELAILVLCSEGDDYRWALFRDSRQNRPSNSGREN